MNNVVIRKEVQDAIDAGLAVVALESTIISHGMPYPQNVKTAREVEAIVRGNGAVPATIAIIDGVIRVGLGDAELEHLGTTGLKCQKCSRRDLAPIVARKGTGSTTVAATMFIAHKAGIRVFVTGGIGGVHRGFEDTMDVSADLTELGRTPVAVVCAGVKFILDIPRTLEYLETQGVTVASFGQDNFPAFFVPDSRCLASQRCDSVEECASIIYANHELDLRSGVLFGIPIPEQFASKSEEIQAATNKALEEARQRNIKGRDITPFLLLRIAEITGGESLKTNIALIKNNAKVGAQIANRLSKIGKSSANPHLDPFPPLAPAVHKLANHSPQPRRQRDSTPSVMVVGGAARDVIASPKGGAVLIPRTSNPGEVIRRWGGVGRNIAEALGRLDCRPLLCSAMGEDKFADFVGHQQKLGVDTSFVFKSSERTPTYVAINDSVSDLAIAVSDMELNDTILPETLPSGWKEKLKSVSFVVMETNMPQRTLEFVAKECHDHHIPVWLEPVSVAKARAAVHVLPHLTYISPNIDELFSITRALQGTTTQADSGSHSPGDHHAPMAAFGSARSRIDTASVDDVKEQMSRVLDAGTKHVLMTMGRRGLLLGSRGIDVMPKGFEYFEMVYDVKEQMSRVLDAGTKHVLVTMGRRGVLLGSRGTDAMPTGNTSPIPHEFRLFPSEEVRRIKSTNGAGDCFVGGAVCALLNKRALAEAINFGQLCARLTLQTSDVCSPRLSKSLLPPSPASRSKM